MAARRQIARTETTYTVVANKTFFNMSTSPKASMRQAAKKFALTREFEETQENCWYYEGRIINNRWQFSPAGKRS